MSVLASLLVRIFAIVALVMSAATMARAPLTDDVGTARGHYGHQVIADAMMPGAVHGPTDSNSGAHHDTLCVSACAIADALPNLAGIRHPLTIALKSVPFQDIGRTAFAPEPAQRPPQSTPILA